MALKLNIQSGLLALGTALVPVYIFPSGSIQPTHLILTAFIALQFIFHGVPPTSWGALLGAFCVYVLFLETSYMAVGKDASSIINAVFIFFNLMLAAAVFGFVRRHGVRALTVGLIASTLYVVTEVLVSGVDLTGIRDAGRLTASFNNPNQLGYFSACLLSLTYLLHRHGAFGYSLAAGLMACALFLSIASLSKAAMIANFAIMLFALMPRRGGLPLVLWVAGLSASIALLAWLIPRSMVDDYLFVQRLVSMAQESDSSLAARGYFAVLEGSGWQLVFGLGAENTYEIVGHEVHSTLGSIVNMYGFIGFLLFGAALLIWARELLRSYGFIGLICISGPAMLYGLTHNGTRFTIFWILFATSLAMARSYNVPSELNPISQKILRRRIWARA